MEGSQPLMISERKTGRKGEEKKKKRESKIQCKPFITREPVVRCWNLCVLYLSPSFFLFFAFVSCLCLCISLLPSYCFSRCLYLCVCFCFCICLFVSGAGISPRLSLALAFQSQFSAGMALVWTEEERAVLAARDTAWDHRRQPHLAHLPPLPSFTDEAAEREFAVLCEGFADITATCKPLPAIRVWGKEADR